MKVSILVKSMALLIVFVLLVGTTACKNITPEINTGIIDDDYVLDISGKIVFTISNESGAEAESKAPRAFVKAFEKKYPEVEVEVEPADMNTFSTRVAAGDIGDVFWTAEKGANTFKKHNAILMLDYYVEKLGIDKSNIYSGALTAGMIDGRLYMVPRNLGQQVLFYNADALAASGISINNKEALSWDTFKSICQELTITENGETIQAGASFRLWWTPVWLAFANGWGGKWCDTENKKVSFISDDNVMKGINEMFDAVSSGWMLMEDATGKAGSLAEYDRVFRTFGDMQWITGFGTMYDSKDVAWDFCPFPAFPTHSVCTGATGYVVYNRTRNVDAAAALALFFLTEEGQKAYHSTTGGNIPLLKSQANEDFWRLPNSNWSDKNFDAFISYPDAAIPATVIVMAPYEISEILSDNNMYANFTRVLNGQISVSDLFSELETQCNQIWSKLTV